uniref:Uncharacterized protein n=1 Tax=Anguilla anguilla TaxID=7936 RepID=A0A0E9WE94_ANGAN
MTANVSQYYVQVQHVQVHFKTRSVYQFVLTNLVMQLAQLEKYNIQLYK